MGRRRSERDGGKEENEGEGGRGRLEERKRGCRKMNVGRREMGRRKREEEKGKSEMGKVQKKLPWSEPSVQRRA